ncbi:M15 family metallopeptidase [Luteimonas viscosa]|uniref:M15 family metallopeptidase n=1 Tax=Luteimonas viscosa TaxID=1132694 RepID=A0A5D4XNA8_9GAMM|nr:M15 family metallopeptidase [Luteimonas viscosa]TYT26158.1 M15 family metallopeptidase [Luteimonas viscosa]
MTPTDLQRLLAAAGHYTGAIDGEIGPKSLAAIDAILTAHAAECTSDPARWSARRRSAGAAQLALRHAGCDPGVIDGYAGNQTTGALLQWNHRQAYGRDLVLDTTRTGPAVDSGFPKQSGCNGYYGAPGPAVERQLVMVDLPFPMRLDWNLSRRVTRVQLHARCAESALAAMKEILRKYGLDELRRLGLDRNAGTYNPRRMRGGSAWSMHAYGCAWDFFAGPNGLTTRCPQALFCGREYRKFFDIWEAHGWISLGRAIGRDWMHVQAARL